MDKTDYILRALSKISKKRWEHYAITRIYHQLNDPEIEFICQQCIRKENGKIYLVDLFFPQLALYLEIDEGHHDSDQAKIDDAVRRLDITEVTGYQEERIAASNVTLEELNQDIDRFIELVRQRKAELLTQNAFKEWDYEHRYTAKQHLDAGSVTVGPDAVFRYHKDALNCFGYTKGHHQSGSWDIPDAIRDGMGLSGKCMVWFPKLYEQAEWKNSLSETGDEIIECNKDPQKGYTEKWDTRIVMAHSRDELNRTLYRFLGVFEVIPKYKTGNKKVFRRVSTTVNTYPKPISAKR